MGLCISKPTVAFIADEQGNLDGYIVRNPTRSERRAAEASQEHVLRTLGMEAAVRLAEGERLHQFGTPNSPRFAAVAPTQRTFHADGTIETSNNITVYPSR
jgi:hypothetical protein